MPRTTLSTSCTSHSATVRMWTRVTSRHEESGVPNTLYILSGLARESVGVCADAVRSARPPGFGGQASVFIHGVFILECFTFSSGSLDRDS